jgi:hypothetical protein
MAVGQGVQQQGAAGDDATESGPLDAPPPVSPSTSLLSLGLALGGAGLVGLALVGTIYAVVAHQINDTSTSTTAAATATTLAPALNPQTSTTLGAGTLAPRPLDQIVITTPPPGYVPVSPGDGPNGPFDLDAFLQFSADPRADRTAFDANGFARGFARSWRRPGTLGESRIVVSVFEFASAQGAEAIEAYESGRTVRDDDGVPFPIPGASALKFTHRSGGRTVYGYAVTIRRTGENRLYYLTALYPTNFPPSEITDLTARQLQRIQAA